jgi:hypothetical protein
MSIICIFEILYIFCYVQILGICGSCWFVPIALTNDYSSCKGSGILMDTLWTKTSGMFAVIYEVYAGKKI